MSTTLLAGANRSAGLAASLRQLLPDLIFGVLVIYNTIRLFRHAMWRDEVQAFMLAAASNTPLDLFAKVGYEGHPGLWYLLLWAITRFTGDPFFMQVAHLLIALGVWVLIWRLSPFRPIENLLLLLGFCLFWEYFIISRGYALMALVGFGFIALRTARPTDRFWPFVLLGLLANTEVFGTIWSLGLGAFFLWQERREWRSTLVGPALFAVCLAVALVTMVPAPDYMLVQAKPSLELGHLDKPLRYVVFAFFPFIWPFAPDALRTLGNLGAALAATPFGGNPAEQLVVLITGAPTSLLLTLAVLAAPLVACWIVLRDPIRVAQYAMIYVGVLLFAQLWQFPGSPRHHGILFIALVGTVWMWRSAMLPARPVSWAFIALLVVNALAGLTTLAADNRPFSQGRNTALWLERHHLDEGLLIATRDYAGSTVAGYLQRPLYYPECECFGTYIEWSTRRKHALSTEQVVHRIAAVMKAENKSDAVLIYSDREELQKQTAEPNLTFRPLKRFANATVGDEIFTIYRVRTRSEPASH